MEPELWIVLGREPVLWRLPYFVRWEGTTARLSAALAFRRFELEAAAKVLALHGQPDKADWVISHRLLARIAHKTPGGDPAAYYAWNQPRPPEQKIIEGREERSEFIDQLYQSGVGESPEQLSYFWREFCLHAAHWLINKEKPVDMIFLRLHNCPLRVNWKIILTQRLRGLGPALRRARGEDREYVMDRWGFREELLSLDLLAMDNREETCYRHVEVEHLKPWWKNVKRVEAQRKHQSGPSRYADYFLDSVRRFIPVAIRLYLGWLALLGKPGATHCRSGHAGRHFLVPHPLAGSLRPTAGRYDALPVQVLDRLPRFMPSSEPEPLPATHGVVPEVPAVQPPLENVRNGQHDQPIPDVAQSGNATT